MKLSAISKTIGGALGSAVVLSLNPLSFAAAYAQDAISDETTETVERIQVTGTNIRGVDMEGAQPLTVLTAEDIAKTGASTISDLMRTVSQTRGGLGSFDTTQSGATSTSTPAGQAAASLRGIGPSATLTLVNGRRIAASSFAAGTENFVDVNSIPASAVERVEILATGASAIYGADAVAGVINYILKDNYEGLELNGRYENTTNSHDHGATNFQVLWGKSFDNSNVTAYLDYYDRNDARATDFSQTRDPLLTSSYSYLPKNTPNIYYFAARDGNEIGAPNCASPLVTTEFGEEICAYYGNEDDYFETPLTAYSGGVTYTQEINDLTWRTELLVSHNKSTSFSSPAPINQVDDSEGPWVPETALDVFDDTTRNALLDNMYIDPFTSFAGQDLYGFQYDARFSTPRTIEIDTTAYRLVSVLQGEFNDWEWEAGVTYSNSESSQEAVAGIYNRYKYTAAVHGELCSDGSIADYDYDSDVLTCGSGSLVNAYNPFAVGVTANDQILALTQEVPTRDGTSEVFALDAKVNGELMQWGDEAIMMAAGVEFRREEITDTPSLNAQAQASNDYLVDVFGFGSSLSAADRNQFGAFVELFVPVSEKLDVSLAGRFDDYNDFGSTFNPKIGVVFRPVDDLILRGAWSTAFRAPSLTQAGVKLRTTRASFDCSANQAVADLYCEGQGSVRGNNVLELGNASLKAEESEALSIGLAYSPTEKTHITIDYWQFDHEDIVDTNMTGVLAAAINDASLRHCGIVPEGQTGISYDPDLCLVTDDSGLTIEEDGANLTEILDAWIAFDDPRFYELPLYRDHILQLENTGTQELSGVDWRIIQDIELSKGTIELGFSGTHYLSYDRNKPGSDEIEELAGTFRYPETVASAEIFYVTDDWYAGAYVYYTGSYQDDIIRLRNREFDEVEALGVLDADGNRDVESWTTVTLSAGYYFENMDLRFTLDNLFDEDAPVAYGSARGFDAYNHDPYGTTYSVSLSYYFK
ncbi:TonB-dependent receptor [Alteromonas sp. KUL49]|uniref:TonB-dependent receptor domain-containing protein n=1 Tax=Alteromonas sp. KUL49 TaxID=2480798 RepID=UPI00102F291B|nr:TonB-dependent receptor [Alteromonas sp. KUL49]TAP42565.1 TonB-dependent receptor [Alteromonas sp. KUL49]GEA10200.1 TonB-dependent receptor [Alteromonas sp. KUL49]